jgi:hypothetical protein
VHGLLSSAPTRASIGAILALASHLFRRGNNKPLDADYSAAKAVAQLKSKWRLVAFIAKTAVSTRMIFTRVLVVKTLFRRVM